MPLYPGTPEVELKAASNVLKDGYAETLLTLPSHAGTHIDAPAHMIAQGRTLDSYPPETFFGKALIVALAPSGRIPEYAFNDPEAEEVEFVLLRTDWAGLWGNPGYFEGYPVLTVLSAERIASLNPKAVGIDAPSFDEAGSTDFPIHRFFLERGILLIENLHYPDSLPSSPFFFACPPLKTANADGAPVRAVALIEGLYPPGSKT